MYQKLSLSLILLLIFNVCWASQAMLKAPRLKKGDAISLIAPGSHILKEQLRFSQERIEKLGLKVQPAKHILGRSGYFAGEEKERVSMINEAFRDSKIKALFSVRGGYGAALLLDQIDYEAIKKNPKIVMGYSDITALLLAIHQKTGLITFHGPMTKYPWPSFTVKNVKDVLFEGKKVTFSNPIEEDIGEKDLIQTENRVTTINSGIAEGRILGGNLAVLTSIIETEYFPKNWKGKILFLEDVGEHSYAIDRMLAMLKQAGVLSQISGFIFGTCFQCTATKEGGFSSFQVSEVLERYIKPLGIPAFFGAMIGHQDELFVIPEGALVKMDADKGTITLLENPVI